MKIIPKKSETTLPSVQGDDPFGRMLAAFAPWTGFLDDFRLRDAFDGSALPATHVTEEEGAYVARIDLPGVDKDGLEVALDGHLLTVKARRHTKTSRGESSMEYRRSFTLPDHVKTDDIAGVLKDGILELRMPKDAVAKPRRIDIAA